MLAKSIRNIVFRCSAQTPRLVNINVQINGKRLTFQFPENTKLAPNLERVRAPRDFQCGFSCSCGTCTVALGETDFQELMKQQPISSNEQKVLNENNFELNIRLSCQLTVKPELQKYTFIIDA